MAPASAGGPPEGAPLPSAAAEGTDGAIVTAEGGEKGAKEKEEMDPQVAFFCTLAGLPMKEVDTFDKRRHITKLETFQAAADRSQSQSQSGAEMQQGGTATDNLLPTETIPFLALHQSFVNLKELFIVQQGLLALFPEPAAPGSSSSSFGQDPSASSSSQMPPEAV